MLIMIALALGIVAALVVVAALGVLYWRLTSRWRLLTTVAGLLVGALVAYRRHSSE